MCLDLLSDSFFAFLLSLSTPVSFLPSFLLNETRRRYTKINVPLEHFSGSEDPVRKYKGGESDSGENAGSESTGCQKTTGDLTHR